MKSRLHTFCVFFLVFFLAINIVPIRLSFAASTVHFLTDTMNRGAGGSITFSGVNYQNGQSTSANEANYVVTGNPPSNYYFYQWVVMWLRQQSWVANQYSQTTTFYLREEAYLKAAFYSPIYTDNPPSPITWGTKQRITGTASQYSGQSLSVVYCSQGSGMGPPNRNGVPPFGSGNNGYLWKTVTVNSGAWDTGYIYPTLPISLGQQLPQTYDVYALYGSDPTSEVDSNVVSFTLNPATPQMSAPTLTPGSIQLGQATTITDEIFSSAYVNSNDLSGTLTVQARKQGVSTWTDIATQSFTSSYGYSNRYGQYGDYYDLSTSWTPSEAGTFEVRIVYGGNHYFNPVTSSSSLITVGQPTYDVTIYAHCNTESADISVQVKKDSDTSGPNTPTTFTGLAGTHSFTVPSSDGSGHAFKQWSTGETSTTLTVSSGGTYTAYYEQPPPVYQFTVNAHCNTEGMDVGVTVVVDGSSYSTPYTFTSTVATHSFTVPTTDSRDDPFKQWSTTETSPSITVTSGGTYTAYYGSVQRKLTVYCAHDSPSPPIGDNYRDDGSSITCSVASQVTEGGTIWICVGWSGTGSVNPSSGTSNLVTFPITQDSTITWNWRADNPPSTPSTPLWTSTRQILSTLQDASFQSSASDPDNDQIRIVFDWGDGSAYTSSLRSSGSTVSMDHSWSLTGMFEVKTKAVDVFGAESAWSSHLDITVAFKAPNAQWAGCIFKSTTLTATYIEAQWIEPNYNIGILDLGAKTGTWIGIGGTGNTNLIQAGIVASWGTGVRPFYATVSGQSYKEVDDWGHCSLFGTGPHTGDLMKATISLIGINSWQISVRDITQNWAPWVSVVTFSPDLTTGEWIHEPAAKGSPIVVSFSDVVFTDARVTMGGTVYRVGDHSSGLNLWNLQKNGVTCTTISEITNYETFTISDTGQRPTTSTAPTTTLSLHSHADLNVYDSLGRHDGIDSTTGLIEVEIPSSLFEVDMNGTQRIFLNEQDSYQVDLVGTGDGDFSLHSQISENGTITLDNWTNATITANETKTYSLIHQISLENLNSKTIVGEGCNSSLTVTVENDGNYTETFNVTAYANSLIIGSQLVTVDCANSSTLAFGWDATSLPKGNYTLSACAETVAGEIDTLDNNCTSNLPVHVGVPGDISGPTRGVYDGTCNMRDVQYLILRFNTNPSSSNWNPNADINDDGTVNMRDIQIAILNFNRHE